MDHVLDRDGAGRAVERLVVERKPRVAIDVVHDVPRELRVVGHLLGVQPQSDDLGGTESGGQVAAPAAHQIEEPPAGGQDLRVETAERGDRAVVDVDDLARDVVEPLVRRLVVPRVRGRREETVAADLVHHGAPSVTSTAGTRGGTVTTRSGHPSLYQINTRMWLQELGVALGRPATLEDVPDASIDPFAADGFDWVWLLGVWQTGEAGRQVSRSQPEWQAEYRAAPARLHCRRRVRLAVRHSRLRRQSRLRRPASPRALPQAAGRPRRPAPAGLRAQSHRARSSVGARASGVLRPRRRGRPDARALELLPRRHGSRTPRARPRARSVLPRLARHPPGQLPPRRAPSGDARRARKHRRSVRRRPLRHGDARLARRHRAHLGRSRAAERRDPAQRRSVLARGHRARPPATAGLPVHGRGVLGPRVDAPAAGVRLHLRQAPLRSPARPGRPRGARPPHRGPGRISAGRCDSWKTTTSRAPPPPFRRRSTRRPACSPSSCRAFASSTRGNARVGDCGPPTTSAVGFPSPSTRI